MNNKYLFWTVVIYTILLSLYGSTGFAGVVWSAAYYFSVFAIWVALFMFTAIIAFLSHPKVQDKLNVSPIDMTPRKVWVSSAIGIVIAGIWIIGLDSPWMALGQTIFVVESFFLKSYMAGKSVRNAA